MLDCWGVRAGRAEAADPAETDAARELCVAEAETVGAAATDAEAGAETVAAAAPVGASGIGCTDFESTFAGTPEGEKAGKEVEADAEAE